MKKFYFCTLALLISLTTLAQSKIHRGFERAQLQLSTQQNTAVKPTKVIPNDKSPGDTLWSEDFTNGLPTGWYVQDNTGNNYNWVVNSGPIQNNNSTPAGFTNASAIASNSGGNYMVLFSDEYNRIQLAATGAADDMDSYFQTSGIQVNNALGLSVVFQQKFRLCCSITPPKEAVLSVSTDSTFTTNYQEYDILAGYGHLQTPDPHNMSINISSIAANYTGKIWLRFHVKSGISHYYNMIDDISIVESPINDLVTTNASYGFTPIGTIGYQYTRIPVAHIQPIDFSIATNNIGTADQIGTNFTVDINDGSSSVFNQSTTDTTLNSLSLDTLVMNSAWTPPATIGIPYTATIDVYSDSTDLTPSNNTFTFPPFEVSQYMYALDDYGTPYNALAQADPNGATEHEVGNHFDAVVNDIATGIEFLAGSATTLGTSIDAVLYQANFNTLPNTYTEIGRSANYVVTAADTITPKTLLLVDPSTGGSPAIVAGETYFATIHSPNSNFRFATSGTSLVSISSSYDKRRSTVSFPNRGAATTTYRLVNTPMIRLSLEPIIGNINEQHGKVNFNIFPNPSNGVFNISITSNEGNNVQLTVKNIVGQTVITKTINGTGKTKETISLTDYSKGIYFLTIGNETVKLIVE